MFWRGTTFGVLWVLGSPGSIHQLQAGFDYATNTVTLQLDHEPVGEPLPLDRWRSGQEILLDVGGSAVDVSVRYKASMGDDIPIFRVSVDGRPLVSRDALDSTITYAMITLILPVALGIIGIAVMPRPITVLLLLLTGVAAVTWVAGMVQVARARWFDMAPLGYARSESIPVSLFVFGGLFLLVEASTLAAIATLAR